MYHIHRPVNYVLYACIHSVSCVNVRACHWHCCITVCVCRGGARGGGVTHCVHVCINHVCVCACVVCVSLRMHVCVKSLPCSGCTMCVSLCVCARAHPTRLSQFLPSAKGKHTNSHLAPSPDVLAVFWSRGVECLDPRSVPSSLSPASRHSECTRIWQKPLRPLTKRGKPFHFGTDRTIKSSLKAANALLKVTDSQFEFRFCFGFGWLTSKTANMKLLYKKKMSLLFVQKSGMKEL